MTVHTPSEQPVCNEPAGNDSAYIVDAAHAGASAFRGLCAKIDAIGEETYGRTGRDVDDRDYRAIVAAIRTSLSAHVVDASEAHANGYLRALADMICTSLDGCCTDLLDSEWNPIANTEAGFAGASERQ